MRGINERDYPVQNIRLDDRAHVEMNVILETNFVYIYI